VLGGTQPPVKALTTPVKALPSLERVQNPTLAKALTTSQGIAYPVTKETSTPAKVSPSLVRALKPPFAKAR